MSYPQRVSEGDFQATVLAGASLFGWKAMHVRPVHTRDGGADRYLVPTTSEGWPDLTLARAGTVLHLELKGSTGKPTLAQLEWLYALDGWLVYPRHLDAILDTLRTGRVNNMRGLKVDANGNTREVGS